MPWTPLLYEQILARLVAAFQAETQNELGHRQAKGGQTSPAELHASQGLAVNLAPNNTAELPLWTSMKKFDFGLISGVFKRREPACRALLALV